MCVLNLTCYRPFLAVTATQHYKIQNTKYNTSLLLVRLSTHTHTHTHRRIFSMPITNSCRSTAGRETPFTSKHLLCSTFRSVRGDTKCYIGRPKTAKTGLNIPKISHSALSGDSAGVTSAPNHSTCFQ